MDKGKQADVTLAQDDDQQNLTTMELMLKAMEDRIIGAVCIKMQDIIADNMAKTTHDIKDIRHNMAKQSEEIHEIKENISILDNEQQATVENLSAEKT